MTERFTPFAGYKALPSSLVPPGYVGGKVRVLAGDYQAAALAPGETIMLGWLPEGGIVVGATVMADPLGAGVAVSLGDDEDDDRYFEDKSAAASSRIELDKMSGFLYRAPQRRCIKLKVEGAAATGLVRAALFYSLE